MSLHTGCREGPQTTPRNAGGRLPAALSAFVLQSLPAWPLLLRSIVFPAVLLTLITYVGHAAGEESLDPQQPSVSTRGAYNSNVGVAMCQSVIYSRFQRHRWKDTEVQLLIRASARGASPATPRSAPVMGSGLVWLLALVGGFAVGNLYWAQPLLGVIAGDFGVSTGTAATLVTVTQIGYAIGIVLLV